MYICLLLVNPIPYESCWITSLLNDIQYVMYYTKFLIFTKLVRLMPVPGRVAPFPFEAQLVSPLTPSSPNMTLTILDSGC